MSKDQKHIEPTIIKLAQAMVKDKRELESLIESGVSPKELQDRGYKFADVVKL